MTIELDHTIVPSRDQIASAKLLAELLGVPWAKTSLGPFSPVYVNNGLTLDFQTTDEDFPIYHFCFRVSDTEFDAILSRIKAAGIPGNCAKPFFLYKERARKNSNRLNYHPLRRAIQQLDSAALIQEALPMKL